jgi:hypothetical protein
MLERPPPGFSTELSGIAGFMTRKLSVALQYFVGRDSVVSVAPGYGLDGPGIESLWGLDIPHFSRLPTQCLIEWVLGLFPRGKAAGTWLNQPSPSKCRG